MKTMLTFEESDLKEAVFQVLKKQSKIMKSCTFHYDPGDPGDPRGNTTRVYAEVEVEEETTGRPTLNYPPGAR